MLDMVTLVRVYQLSIIQSFNISSSVYINNLKQSIYA